ncbi:gamma-glutamyl-gamma-aminobutyrate hydrolase family protein [Sulfitobacter sp. D35]|uniref:glutamine amidotransferase-related protein n=1 Tax=Sulfitobacter sp. D35 TaxID=3083252 RepID=UPI00296EB2AF|nr:gamma-glutamyl-gamma-aminobutyrate hydrolase family protein [Sulfitobacter sp. D35]MDW4497287.1 gamma-glutamyl-gamma-aminobutyrate hydrolase family protein [Sulfitobacter sp. D35]
MQRRILLIRHGPEPTDDRVTTFCQIEGFAPDTRNPWRGEDAGSIAEDVAGVVLYGGNYNADSVSENPFLRAEYRLIEETLAAGLPLLGICQGAQMIARAHGAGTGPLADGRYEFGYYEVSPTEAGKDFLPHPLHFTQWHFHTFDLPAGATHLARSAAFENQAFAIGPHVTGLQFHPEVTIEGFRRWQAAGTETYGRPGAQDRDAQTALMLRHDAAQAAWFYGFLARYFGTAKAPARALDESRPSDGQPRSGQIPAGATQD